MNKDTPSKRAYDLTLRSRQAEQTRELILTAAAELIAEDGLQALSVAEVARRAAVSLRTVWRNFATLDELMDAVDRRLAEIGPTLTPSFLAMDQHVVSQYTFWDEHASFILASLAWRFSQAEAPPARAERLQSFLESFEALTPGLTPEMRRVGAAAISLLPNAMSWATLRKEFPWSAEEAGQAVGWIIQLVINELIRQSESKPASPPTSLGKDGEGVARVAQDPN